MDWNNDNDFGGHIGRMGRGFHGMELSPRLGIGIGLMVLFLVAAAVALILFSRLVARGRSRTECQECKNAAERSSSESPRETLDRRFAEGKIKRKAYIKARDLLG